MKKVYSFIARLFAALFGGVIFAITNPSPTDPIVMLKIFGPENPDWVKTFGA